MVDKSVAACLGVVCGALYMASVIMIGCSFDTLDPLHAGIEFNTVNKQINQDQVFLSGRYFLGLGKAFLEFPRNEQTIDFSTSSDADEPALLMERSQVTVECSMQYVLKLDKLTAIYSAYELNYHDKMVKEATNAIKNTASDYDVAKFYQERRTVSAEMEAAVRVALERENAILTDFQLRKIGLREQNEQDVIRKIVTAEDQRTALNLRQVDQITAETTVIAGEADQLIAIFQAEKQRNATVLEEQAAATAKAVTISSEASAFNIIKTALGFSQDELLQYLWIKKLRSLPATAKLLVGFDDAAISSTT